MKDIRAYCELTLAMLIVGSSVVVGKFITTSFPVFLASGLRFAIASVILVPLLLIRERSFSSISRKDWLILFLQAFTGIFLFSVLLLYGLRFTSAAEGGIITSTTPAVLGIISFLFLKEQLTLRKILGILLTVSGVLLVNVFGTSLSLNQELGTISFTGNVLIFGAVIAEALFTIFRKVLSKNVSSLATATWVSVLGCGMFFPFSLYEIREFDFSAVTFPAWVAIGYYGVVVTVIAFILWFQGVSKVPTSTAAAFTGVMPASAVGLSYLILQEPFSWGHLIGGACVLFGIGCITRTPATARKKKTGYLEELENIA